MKREVCLWSARDPRAESIVSGILPVPPERRTDRQYSKIFFIWFSMNFNILSFVCHPSYTGDLHTRCSGSLLGRSVQPPSASGCGTRAWSSYFSTSFVPPCRPICEHLRFPFPSTLRKLITGLRSGSELPGVRERVRNPGSGGSRFDCI